MNARGGIPRSPSRPKSLSLTDHEIERIKAAIQTWDSYGVNADRQWLQPLIEELFLGCLPR
jgi:hypothetical protein